MDVKEVLLMVVIPLYAIVSPYFAARARSPIVGLIAPYVIGILVLNMASLLPGADVAVHRRISFYLLGFMFLMTVMQRIIYLHKRTGRWHASWNADQV